jgi:hypothetical protein
MISKILVGRKTSEVVENEYESSFGEGQHIGIYPADSILRAVHLVVPPGRPIWKPLRLLDLEVANSILVAERTQLTPEDAAIHPEIQTSTPGDRSVPFSGPVSANVERPRHHQGARYERNRRAS